MIGVPEGIIYEWGFERNEKRLGFWKENQKNAVRRGIADNWGF